MAQRIGGVVLPPLFLGPDRRKVVDGFEYYGMDILQKASSQPMQLSGSAYWVSDRLFSDIIDAVFKQVHRAGFRIMVAHGHGPSNNFIIDKKTDLEQRYGLKIFTIWRGMEERDPKTEFQYDHAAANETSIMMSLHPSLVHMDQLPEDRWEEPLGLIGEDPRTNASMDHGDNIVNIHLGRMESILRKELEEISHT